MSFDYAAQQKETVHSCNLCGWNRFEPYASKDRYGLPVESVRCAGCGLVFLNPRMTAHAYREFYRSGAYRELLSEFYGKPVTAESIEADQEQYAQKLIRVLEPQMEKRGVYHLLDVGGSTGVVAKALAKHFELDATVIEPSEAEAKRAEARGLTVFHGTLEDYDSEWNKFELVTLCQTIDHLLDISEALKRLRCLLREGGLFFVDIVDYRVPFHKSGREGAVKVDHPFYLEPWNMATFLTRAGFNRKWSSYDADGLHVNFVCEGA